jgi:RNA polymerase sigma-70 factor (ECF subfamily)
VSTDRDDVSLLEAHVVGDPAAFGELFARHRDRLWAVALRTTGNPEDAADALQDALISAFRRADSFRGDSAVTTWLHRIVVNACLDRLRRAKARAADSLPDDLEEHAARGSVLAAADPAADPEAHALATERSFRVLSALEELPPDQKAALVLVDMEGYPVQEAGRILDVPTGTIKSRCARGRARLAVLLADLDTPTVHGTAAGGTPQGADASHSGDPRRGRPQEHAEERPEGRPDLHRNDEREEVSGHE